MARAIDLELGHIFEGEFRGGLASGRGRVIYNKESSETIAHHYEGQFRDGMRDGTGTMFFTVPGQDGFNQKESLWENDEENDFEEFDSDNEEDELRK